MHKYLMFLIVFLTTSFCTNSNGNNYNKPITKLNKEKIIEESYKSELLNLVNQLRKEGCRCGRKKMRSVPPLKWNNQLEQAAKIHVLDMSKNNFFEHKGSDGSSISDRIERTGYQWKAVGENILWGESNVQQVFLGWKDSPPHCKTMMSGSYHEMGAAFAGRYWAQDFGRQ